MCAVAFIAAAYAMPDSIFGSLLSLAVAFLLLGVFALLGIRVLFPDWLRSHWFRKLE